MAKNGNPSPRFMENKGQWPVQVSHALRVANTDIFFESDRLTFNFFRLNHTHDGHGHGHSDPQGTFAYQVQFLGAGSDCQIEGGYPYGDYTNYILGSDPSNWASRVKAFAKLKYTDLYEGIDLEYYEHNGHLKYDIRLAAGVDPGIFQMKYTGASKVQLVNGQLSVVNPIGAVMESSLMDKSNSLSANSICKMKSSHSDSHQVSTRALNWS